MNKLNSFKISYDKLIESENLQSEEVILWILISYFIITVGIMVAGVFLKIGLLLGIGIIANELFLFAPLFVVPKWIAKYLYYLIECKVNKKG